MMINGCDGKVFEVPELFCATSSQLRWLQQPPIVPSESIWMVSRPKLKTYTLRERFARLLGRFAWRGTYKPYFFCKRFGVI
jgi:hypothetical protein